MSQFESGLLDVIVASLSQSDARTANVESEPFTGMIPGRTDEGPGPIDVDIVNDSVLELLSANQRTSFVDRAKEFFGFPPGPGVSGTFETTGTLQRVNERVNALGNPVSSRAFSVGNDAGLPGRFFTRLRFTGTGTVSLTFQNVSRSSQILSISPEWGYLGSADS